MKLILHIGTPKTGTTALQQFLHANRNSLTAHGFHYATPPHGLRESNRVAAALNVGDNRAVRAFFQKHMGLADRCGAHTILVSGENFSAMSVMDAMLRREACVSAVERDRVLIETLRSLMPESIEASTIVCYFRRPDRYAESLYSQHVKRGIIFTGSFVEFLPLIEPALLYNQHMCLWSGAFGKDSCTVRSYEAARGDIVGDFLVNVAGILDISKFSHNKKAVNERVSRDVLEFKRLKNRSASFKERDMERTILGLVDERLGLRKSEPDYYQDFLTPHERAEFLMLAQPEMEALEASYDIPPFPPFDLDSAAATWNAYPGLGEQRRREIQAEFDSVSRRGAFRLERLSLRSAGVLRKSVPSAGVVLDILKTAGAKHALRRFMKRMQLGNG